VNTSPQRGPAPGRVGEVPRWRLEHYFGKDGELLGFVTLTQRLAIEAQSRLVFPCWMSS
jgi:hypothetical protein